MKSDLALQLEGVSRSWPSFQLGPIDLTVHQGHIVTLVGNNGAGKSTIFRLILQLLQKENGRIRFYSQGKEIDETEAKQKIGFVGNQYDGLQHLSIDELAAFVAHWYPDWNPNQYQRLKERYRIDGQMKYADCSPGVQKKVEWVLAFSHSPQWLFLDEPSAGVDLFSQKLMMEDMMNFMEHEQNSILLASHNLHEIQQVADYLYLLEQGKIVQAFDKDEIAEQWGMIWIDQPLPPSLSNHPHILDALTPTQIVTNHLAELEKFLQAHQIAILRLKRLSFMDAMEYLLTPVPSKKSERTHS